MMNKILRAKITRMLVVNACLLVCVILKPTLVKADTNETNYSVQTHTYKTVGDCKIQLTAFRNPGSGIRPALLYIHGGGFVLAGRMDIVPGYVERFLDAGFVMVSIDYRLAPEIKLKAILEDLADAHKWLRTEGARLFAIDPVRIAVVGESAGGYLALMAGFCFDPRPKALVSFYGFGDITGDWCNRTNTQPKTSSSSVSKEEAYRAVYGPVLTGTSYEDTKRDAFRRYCAQQGIWIREVTGRDPRVEPQAFALLCPIRNVTSDYPTTMLLHGDRDESVPFQESLNMAEALKRHGVKCDLVTATNGVHGFDWYDGGLRNPANAAIFHRVLNFLKTNTK